MNEAAIKTAYPDFGETMSRRKVYKHSYTLCFTELHQAVFSLYDQTNTTSLRGTIVQEPVPMCPSPIVSQSHCAPVPLYTSPTVYYFCRVPAPWSFIALLYPLFLSRCLPVPFVSQPHCVQVPLCTSLLYPTPVVHQSHCVPLTLCDSRLCPFFPSDRQLVITCTQGN